MSQTPVTPGSARTTHPCRRPPSVLVEEYDTEEQYGFAFAADADEALVEAVNDALATLRDDGAYDDIYDSHFSAG